MKPLFYFFGIWRGEKTFAIKDPIIIDDFIISELDGYSLNQIFEKNGLRLKNFIEEFKKERSILFGVAKNSEKLSEFLKFGQLLCPDIIQQSFSIYFLD